MRFIADLHIHSHFSRATSRDLVPEKLALWAGKKGIGVLGTGDFTHPGWVEELKTALVEAEQGFYRLRPGLEKNVKKDLPPSCGTLPRFVLTGELSCIYKKAGRTRKVHHLVFMPGFESLEKLNRILGRIGNIRSDGRPILGLDSKNLLEIVLQADEKGFLIPAHIWTPWFSLFGSKSGFDTVEECFEDMTPHVRALETGLSSDPPMNRLLSGIDGCLLISNSDAHSPAKLGREANLFDTEPDYAHLIEAMSSGNGLLGTIEFFPEEGKYHLDGHRKCGVCLQPEQTEGCDGICTVCEKPLTIGVLHRVHELADREIPRMNKDFSSLIPLSEILSEIFSCGPSTVRVLGAYEELLARLGPELYILLDCPFERLQEVGGPLLAEAVRRMRLSQVIRKGGFDGEYGTIHLFREDERKTISGQIALFLPRGNSAPLIEKGKKYAGRKTRRVEPSLVPPVKPEKDPILDPLNQEQREAVLYDGTHLLIVAGPGTGKTLTLTHRLAYLVRTGKARPEEILALTFTNKAARELEERLMLLIQAEASQGVRVSTFHRFCVEVLRNEGEKVGIPPDFILCSEWDSTQIAERVVSESGSKSLRRAFLRELPLLKRRTVLADGAKTSLEPLLPLFQEYRRRFHEARMLDLDDMEVEVLRLFQSSPDIAEAYGKRYPWVFVDEYQDTDPVEVRILRCLVREDSEQSKWSICAIGDPDQAIYGFRGAETRSFHDFEKDFPGASSIHLSSNYRSTQVILNAAAAVLQKEKPLEGRNGAGGPIHLATCRSGAEEAETIVAEIERLMGGISYFSLDSGRAATHEEVEGYGFGDVGVLFRLNAQGAALEEAFSRAGIPFLRSGELPLILRHPVQTLWRFFLAFRYPESRHFRDLYLDLPDVGGRGEQILKAFTPKGGVGEQVELAIGLHAPDLSGEDEKGALLRLKEMAAGFRGDLGQFLDRLCTARGIDHEILPGDRVALMSLHAAKGLEWPVVFIVGCEEGLLPCSLFGNRDEEEERRLFYVGMTRARRRLILSHADLRLLEGRPTQGGPSPYLKLIPKEFLEPLKRGTWKKKSDSHRQMGLFA